MDIFALVEHTLLHELTNSKAVGEPQANSLIKESYRWDNCLKAKSAKNSGMAPFRIMYSYVMLIVVQTPLHSSRLVASRSMRATTLESLATLTVRLQALETHHQGVGVQYYQD